MAFLFSTNLIGQELIDTTYARLKVQKVLNQGCIAFYDSSGRLTRFEQLNNSSEDYTYYADGKLKTKISSMPPSGKNYKQSSVFKLEYFYNDNGTVSSINSMAIQTYKGNIQEFPAKTST
jgi:hypothetical protein